MWMHSVVKHYCVCVQFIYRTNFRFVESEPHILIFSNTCYRKEKKISLVMIPDLLLLFLSLKYSLRTDNNFSSCSWLQQFYMCGYIKILNRKTLRNQ